MSLPFHVVREKLLPQAATRVRDALGRNICTNQPDVEVLALTLRDIPLSVDKYKDMAGSKGWLTMQFCVLATGPPGFSSVPYTASKKKGEKETNSQPLYTSSGGGDDAETIFFSYEKGRTNKDKGVRVAEIPASEGASEMVAATAPLSTGACVSSFMNEDLLGDRSGFFIDVDVAREVLPAHSLVYLQVASSNKEQAMAGRLLKIKKLKQAEPTQGMLAMCLQAFPKSEDAFEDLQATLAKSHPSIQRNLYHGSVKLFTRTPGRSAFAVVEESGAGCVISDPGGLGEATISSEVALYATGAATVERAAKILTVAMAAGALSVLLRTNTFDSVIMDTGGQTVVAAAVCWNTLLGLEAISQASEWPNSSQILMLPGEEDDRANAVSWTVPAVRLSLEEDGCVFERRLVFELELEPLELEKPFVDAESSRIVSDGCRGRFLPLRLFSTDSAEGESALRSETRQLIISLQLRTENRGSARNGKKRTRMAMVADDMDF